MRQSVHQRGDLTWLSCRLLRDDGERLLVNAIVAGCHDAVRRRADRALVRAIDDDQIRRSTRYLREIVGGQQFSARTARLRFVRRVRYAICNERAICRGTYRADGECAPKASTPVVRRGRPGVAAVPTPCRVTMVVRRGDVRTVIPVAVVIVRVRVVRLAPGIGRRSRSTIRVVVVVAGAAVAVRAIRIASAAGVAVVAGIGVAARGAAPAPVRARAARAVIGVSGGCIIPTAARAAVAAVTRRRCPVVTVPRIRYARVVGAAVRSGARMRSSVAVKIPTTTTRAPPPAKPRAATPLGTKVKSSAIAAKR